MSIDPEDSLEMELGGTDRRTFIKRASMAAAGLSVPGLLEACGSTSVGNATAAGLGPGGLPLARPNVPVTLPIYSDNKAIASGLKPEAGPLQFYNWIAYINPAVVKDFEKKYNVKVQITNFTTIDEAVAKLSSGAVQYDLFVPVQVFLERLVVGKILQPLNLSYIPNLRANIWPALNSPWYDVGSRYTVPYTIYTTGVGWRTDKLPGFNAANLPNPWSALWSKGPSIRGKVGMLDDQHEALAMGLLYDGVTDINTHNAKQVNAAKNSVIKLIQSTNLKFDTNEYQRLADG
ncbi:MAG: extracellular solute-binding protein, partial [Actinomycetota bacterium]|nr:extracellular solute-binding protein [Actinomycetota bacterium]